MLIHPPHLWLPSRRQKIPPMRAQKRLDQRCATTLPANGEHSSASERPRHLFGLYTEAQEEAWGPLKWSKSRIKWCPAKTVEPAEPDEVSSDHDWVTDFEDSHTQDCVDEVLRRICGFREYWRRLGTAVSSRQDKTNWSSPWYRCKFELCVQLSSIENVTYGISPAPERRPMPPNAPLICTRYMLCCRMAVHTHPATQCYRFFPTFFLLSAHTKSSAYLHR